MQPQVSEPRQRILIVEDDGIVRNLLTDILSLDYEVRQTGLGKETLPMLRANDFDLLLLDVRLPDINGLEILQGIRADARLTELPVVLISGKADASDVAEGLTFGANDFIPKPIETAVLQARIRTQVKLKRFQDERKRYILHLEEAERIRTQFSQIASHDLKSPLNNLRMAEQLLREEVEPNERVDVLLNTISSSLDMMQHVVSTFLEMIAIQSQNMNLRHDEIEVSDVINHAVMQYKLAAENKGIALRVDSTAGKVIGDSARLTQVVGNLLSNAIKYSPSNSEVRIWTEERSGRLRLSIADKGKGVPERERHLLFREFSKLSTRPTAGEGSTGLGLWIVRHLMEMQNGHAGADFPESGGSIFWIELEVRG